MITFQDKTIGEIVAEAPLRANVFERRQIDYCCNGGRSLQEVCDEKQIPLDEVLAELEAQPNDEGSVDWQRQRLAKLAGHIVQRHHEYLRQTLPSAAFKLEKVVRAHGSKHAFLAELQQVVTWLADELISHIGKEETILFPHIVALEAASLDGRPSPPAPGGTVGNPVSRMEQEHDDAGHALRKIRELTSGYLAPPDACNTFRALYAQLAELEVDLHTHIHLENNVLFPRAIALEEQKQSPGHASQGHPPLETRDRR